MRYHRSLLLVPFLLSLLSFPTVVATADEPDFSDRRSVPSTFEPSQPGDFWSPAQKLVQEQINLIDRIERALISPDPTQLRGIRGRLSLHLLAVDRLLQRYYAAPEAVCRSAGVGGFSSPVSYLSSEQARAYCALYSSTQKLAALEPWLERRQALLGGGIPVQPLPGTSRTLRLLLPNVPPAEPPLIGRTPKPLISDDAPPLPPAITPLPQATTLLQAAKTLLTEARRNFPDGIPFFAPEAAALIAERNAYELYLEESQRYADFLTIPNSGIASILPAEAYRPDPTVLRNRLIPTPADCLMPKARANDTPGSSARSSVLLSACPQLFAPLSPPNGFTPQLEIQVADGNFQIVQRELDYGFMVDLGEVPLESLDDKLSQAETPLKEFFLTYQPPDQLKELQVDRRRFITGKVEEFCLCDRVFSQAPVVLNHTYLVRSLQFQLPEMVVTGDRILRWRRRNLNLLLETPSRDLLIAFQPVSRRPDGSYIVLWRILKQFPNPHIQDLDKYVDLE